VIGDPLGTLDRSLDPILKFTAGSDKSTVLTGHLSKQTSGCGQAGLCAVQMYGRYSVDIR
jgi:hypothetical protein